MSRRPAPGDWRANLHQGGSGRPLTLTSAEEQTALRATAASGLVVAGVDMLMGEGGPLVLEVNPNPGLGVGAVTGVDAAGEVAAAVVGACREADGRARQPVDY